MTVDEAIEKLIPEIDQGVNFNFEELFSRTLKIHNDSRFLDRVRTEMVEIGIIRRANQNRGYENTYEITKLVREIIEAGGWTKYKAKIEADKKVIPTINVNHKTPLFDKLMRGLVVLLSIGLIWFNIVDKRNELKIHELSDKAQRQKATIDTLTKESQNLNVLLEKERARLKRFVDDSLRQSKSVKQ